MINSTLTSVSEEAEESQDFLCDQELSDYIDSFSSIIDRFESSISILRDEILRIKEDGTRENIDQTCYLIHDLNVRIER